MASASLRISTLYRPLVMFGLVIASLSAARADEATDVAPPVEIEAKAYDLKTIRPSKSGRVYLFQKFDEGFPVDGKIFLLRQGDTPVMAFRVLKTYPATKQIAAKKLLPYEGFPSLDRGSEYRAYEKIGDKVAPVPPTPEDLSDLKELESGENLPAAPTEETAPAEEAPSPAEKTTEAPPPPAEELSDESTEPPPAPSEETPTETPAAEPEADAPVRADDFEMRDSEDDEEADEIGSYFPNFFTMGVGWIAKTNVPGPNMKFSGGMLYSRKFGSSIAGEFGFFYYKSSGEASSGTVTTTVMPLIGTLRYEWHLNDLWTTYVYGGGLYPWVVTNIGATKTQLRNIAQFYPALGGGFFLQTGPNWYLRGNLGIDAMFVGVSLRF